MAAIPVTSGLQLLLESRTITGLSNTDPISAAPDGSGKGNNASASGANRPIYKTNVFGSNPAIGITDQTDFLSGSLASWGAWSGITAMICGMNFPASQAGGARMFSTVAAGQNDSANLTFLHASTQTIQNGTAINSVNPTLNSAASTQPVVIGFCNDSANSDLIVNGVIATRTHAAGAPSTPTLYSTGLISGGTPTASNNAVFDAFFYVLYNRRLTVAEVAQVVCWMQTELGALTIAGGTSGFTGLSGVGRLGT